VTKNMSKFLVVVATALSWQPTSAAEFKHGLAAMRQGNIAKAVAIWTPLAERGEVVPQQMLGAAYSKSISKLSWKADYVKAASWYRRCEPNSALCAYGLAELYYESHGVPYDRARAAALYKTFVASEIDYPEAVSAARLRLGLMYQLGDGVPADNAVAQKYFASAANDGNAEAQFWLGKSYEDGTLTTGRDLMQANKWYRIAMKHPDEAPFAQWASKKLERSMSRQDVERSRQLATTYIAPR
jgi:TPR repeat protein